MPEYRRLSVFIYLLYPMFYSARSFAQTAQDSLGVFPGSYAGTELSFFMSVVKVIVALAITLVLLVAAVWLLKRFLSLRSVPGLSGGAIRVLEVRYIAPRKAIALVRVADKVLIVGISEQSMNTLGELPPDAIPDITTTADGQSGFGSILKRFTGKQDET